MVRSFTPVAQALAGTNRVLLLGGLAVIFHGLPRLTKDADIWLEPGISEDEWASRLTLVLKDFPDAYLWDLSTRERISTEELAECVGTVGVIRVGGIEGDLDIFRKPNNLGTRDFEEAWLASLEMPTEKLRVLDATLLLATKLGTERQMDQDDIVFLEGKIRGDFSQILRTCSADEARKLFARYADHETCRSALTNPDAGVRALAIATLHELAAEQNPFAREMLADLDHGAP